MSSFHTTWILYNIQTFKKKLVSSHWVQALMSVCKMDFCTWREEGFIYKSGNSKIDFIKRARTSVITKTKCPYHTCIYICIYITCLGFCVSACIDYSRAVSPLCITPFLKRTLDKVEFSWLPSGYLRFPKFNIRSAKHNVNLVTWHLCFCDWLGWPKKYGFR